MSVKDILKIIAILAVFYLLAPYLLAGINKLFISPRVEVSYATRVAGHITSISMNRQYYLYYLDNNNKTFYDFNAFPASSSPHTGNLSQEEVNKLILGTQLRIGDYVSKDANSIALTVKRGSNVTHWICSSESIEE